MNHAGGLRGFPALANRPGTRLFRSRREIRLQPERVKADARKLVEPALVLTHRREQFPCVRGVQVDEFAFNLRVEEHGFRRSDECRQRRALFGAAEDRLVHIEDVKDGFRGQQSEFANRSRVERRLCEGRPTVQNFLGFDRGGENIGLHLFALDFLFVARDCFFQSLEVGQNQFGVDRFEVVLRVDLARDVDDVGVGEAADDLRNCVGFANRGEELVAEPFALGCALDDSGDVDERHGRRQDSLAAENRRQHVQARVRQVDDPDVRLNRREGIVRRENVVARERIEQGGLSHVGKTDDSD